MKNRRYLQSQTRNLILLLVVMLSSCNTKSTIDIQGHRGCRGLYPENTLSAFAKAIELGVNTLELDIAITKDNKVVVSHEPFMSRTICLKPDGTNITKAEDMQFNLYKMTHEEIKQFDCGTKFHKRFPEQVKVSEYKPLLVEVFDLAKQKNSDVKFNIEIKSKQKYYGTFTPFPSEYVSVVLKEIDEAKINDRVNLQSFDVVILEEVKKQNSEIPIALLVDEDETIETKLSKLSFKPEIISPYFKLLNKENVDNWKFKNFQIIPWTVNSKKGMMQMIDFEVDGIITDYPDVLIGLLEE